MALGPADHKRIALSVAHELRRVLSGANAKRMLSKHQARMAPDGDEPGPTEEPDDFDEMMSELDQGRGHKLEVDPEELHSRSGVMPSDEKEKPITGTKPKPRFGKR